MKYLVALMLVSSVAFAQQTEHFRNVKADTLLTKALTDSGNVLVTGFGKFDSVYARSYGNIVAGSSARTVPAYISDTTKFLRSDSSWAVPPGGVGGGMSGWYVNGNSLVTDTLRFLKPTSMVFTQSGRTLAIYPDTSAGKIATKSDLAAYLPLHSTADSSVSSFWATNLRIARLYGWITNGGTLRTDTLRVLAGKDITLTPSTTTLTIAADTSQYATSTASGFLKYADWTTFNNKGSSNFRGWITNGGSLATDTLRAIAGTYMTLTPSAATLTITADTTKYATSTASGFLKYADWTTFNNKGASNFRGWILNGGALRTDTLRAVAGTDITLSASSAAMTINADTSKYATSSASGFLKYADWTTFNNKGSSSFAGWITNGGTLRTDTLRAIAGTYMTLTPSTTTLTVTADTTKYATSTASGFLKYADWTTFNNKGASNFRGWYENGGVLQTDTLRLIPGTNMSFSRSGTALTINGPAGAAGFYGWYTNGGSLVSDSLRFIQGANITLTQTGRTLTIAGSAGGSTTSVDSIRHIFVDTTGQAITNHGVAAIAYNADSSKYKAVALNSFDTTGQYKVSTGAYVRLTSDSTGKVKIVNEFSSHPTAYAGPGLWIMNAENQLASGTQVNVSGHMRAFPFIIGKTMTIDSLNYIVSTAGAGACTMTIYADSATAGVGPSYPGAKVWVGGRDTTSASIKAQSLRATPLQFKPGVYFATVSSNGTATLRSVPVGAIANVLGYNPTVAATQSYTCYDVTRTYDQFSPSTFATGGTLTVNIGAPMIVMRVKSVP